MASTGFNRGAGLEGPHARVRLKSRSIPTPGANQVLVHNHAIASNPVEWMMQEYSIFISEYPIILGSNVCGNVSVVGSSVTGISPGDRVCGFGAVICNFNMNHGAFQNYTILYGCATVRLAPIISFEHESILSKAVVIAAYM